MVYQQILISTEELQAIVSRLAEQVSQVYDNEQDIVAVVLLEGARYFAEDLLKQVPLPIQVQYLKVSSYLGGTQSTGRVTVEQIETLQESISGKHVLLIDDIYDTGLTLSKVLDQLSAYNPASIKTCVLLEKKIQHTENVDIDFPGTLIENEFVIGYGLDYNQQYRDLPFIAVLSPEYIEE